MNLRSIATMRIPVVCVVGALAIATPLRAAEVAERPEWKVGDNWRFRQVENPGGKESTWRREVIEALPGGPLKVRYGNGNMRDFDGEANEIDKRGPEYSWRRFKFPMSVGADWKHEYNIAGDTWNGLVQSTWKVRAYERITVPAGTFDCFKVEGEAFSNWYSAQAVAQQFNRGTSRTTYWYCPAIKWAARWEIENTPYVTATRTTTISELVSFEQK